MSNYIVYHGLDRIEGSASTIARMLAEQGLPVGPGEIDNPEAAPAMLKDLALIGLITFKEQAS